jgi:H+/Cl- antiporter ClcA
VIGTLAGLGGTVDLVALHWFQHIGYGYGFDPNSRASFLEGVTASPPWRRVLAMAVAGLVAGVGWWALRSRGRPVVTVKASVQPGGPPIPAAETLLDAVLQVVTVGLGSPLGREVAPRQVAAVLTGWVAGAARLSAEERRVLVACGAGAGLAAVYDVPFGGTLYVLEVLLGTFSAPAVVAAMTSSTIAARIAWVGLGDDVQYMVPSVAPGAWLLPWSLGLGPVFGLVAYGFSRWMRAAGDRAPRGRGLIAWCLVVFVAIGLVATMFPQILGNGRGPTQLGFAGQLAPALAATLFALKLLAVIAALRAGAAGGALTPSLALGALMATSVGGLAALVLPQGPSPSSLAIIGAAAFLASSQRMPLTAAALVVEFTRVNHDFIFPILLAAAGSTGVRLACDRWETRLAPLEND